MDAWINGWMDDRVDSRTDRKIKKIDGDGFVLKEGRFEYPKSGMRELRAVPADVNKGIGGGAYYL